MDEKKPRKVKFAPKVQPRKKGQSSAQKPEEKDGKSADADAEQLLRLFNENNARRGARAEKKPAQVAFDLSAASAPPIRTYGVPKDGRSSGPSSGISLKSPETDDEDAIITYESDPISSHKMEKHYRDPWDYQNSNYPTTLPLRMPHAGDPEILDEQEFGEAARNVEYDESTINSAVDLGLMPEGDNKDKMMLFQIPSRLPLGKNPASVKGKEKIGSSVTSSASAKGKEKIGSSVKGSGSKLEEGCKFEELTEGFMGKMVIYRSGAVKLKLGETLYDVSPGSKYLFAENAAAINTKNKKCCVLGEIREHAIVTPDVDFLLDAGNKSD